MFNFLKKSQYTKDVAKAYNQAVEHGKEFDKRLNFSDSSIVDIEEILDYYSNDLNKLRNSPNPVTENKIWSLSLWWGVYIGETLRRNYLKNYIWVNDSEAQGFLPVLSKPDNGAFIFPVNKVYKRLVNGKEDSIVSFYDFMKTQI